MGGKLENNVCDVTRLRDAPPACCLPARDQAQRSEEQRLDHNRTSPLCFAHGPLGFAHARGVMTSSTQTMP